MSPGVMIWGLRLVLVLATLSGARDVAISKEPAYILNSYKQLVASSTLQWTPVSSLQSGQVSSNSVVTIEESAVCRVRDGGETLPGRTDRQAKCIVGAGGKITLRTRYDLLVDLWGMSRMEWQHWDMFSFVPSGTVAFTDQVFVARALRTDQPFILGDLNTRPGHSLNGKIRAHIPDNNTGLYTNYGYHAKFTTTGDVLVEVEPIKYKLSKIQFISRRRKTKSKVFHVGRVTLERPHHTDEVCVTDTLQYNYPKSFHWGRIRGTILGLPTEAIITPNNIEVFKFGMQTSQIVEGERLIHAALSVGTATNVSVRAMLVRTEVPYRAVLESIYASGDSTRNNITGVYTSTRLHQFKEEYEGAFDLGTGEEAKSPCEGNKRTDCCHAYTPSFAPTVSNIFSTSKKSVTTKSTTTQTTTMATTNLTVQPSHPSSTLYPPISSTVSEIDEKRKEIMKMFYPEPLEEENEENINKTVRAAPLQLNSSNKHFLSIHLMVIGICFVIAATNLNL